jgi:hypothetical protein
MQSIKIVSILFCMIFLFSCKDNSTNPKSETPTRDLSINAITTSTTAPCSAIITGTFNAYSDTVQMYDPPFSVVVLTSKTYIPYTLSSVTTLSPKKTYMDTISLSTAGSYSVIMVLYTTTKAIVSDTISITVQ